LLLSQQQSLAELLSNQQRRNGLTWLSNKEVVIMQSIARKLPTVARVILGLIFVVFGLNGFFQFAPAPPMSGPAGAFMGALAATGYFFPLLKLTEIAAGLLLLTGFAVPLALTLLAPVIVNIVAFHLFLAPGSFGVVAVVLASELYLAWTHRRAFAPLFAKRRTSAPVPGEPVLQTVRAQAA
jgi:uncharacterized membrane protein YphA (DoxX/SURF4 family)